LFRAGDGGAMKDWPEVPMSAGYVIYSLDWDKFRRLVERPTRGQLAALAKLLRDEFEELDGEFEDGDPILGWPTDRRSLARIAAERLALPDWYGDLSTPGKNLWEGAIFTACQDCDAIDVGFRVDNDGVYWDVIELAWKHLGVVPGTVTEVALSAFGTRPYRYHPRPGPVKTRAEYDREEAGRRATLDALGKALGQFLKDAERGQKRPDELLEELEKHEGVSRAHKDLVKEFLSDDEPEDEEDDFEEWSPMHSMHDPEEVEKMRAELQSVGPAMTSEKKKDVRQQYQKDLLPAVERVARDGRLLFIQVDT
jgi:hypothetical protein